MGRAQGWPAMQSVNRQRLNHCPTAQGGLRSMHAYKQKNKPPDERTGGRADRMTHRLTDGGRTMDRPTDRQTHRQAHSVRQTDIRHRQTQKDRQTGRHRQAAKIKQQIKQK